MIPVVIGALGTDAIYLEREAERIGNWRTNLNYSNIKIGLNSEKNPGDQRKYAVTQTSVKDHQLTLV